MACCKEDGALMRSRFISCRMTRTLLGSEDANKGMSQPTEYTERSNEASCEFPLRCLIHHSYCGGDEDVIG